MSKGKRSLLAASLILNILFIGVFVGYFLRVTIYPGHPPKVDARDFAITDRQMRHIQDQLQDVHLGNRARLALMEEEKDKALRILRSMPFDANAYQASVDRIQVLREQSVQYVTDRVKKAVPGLSKGERAALAEILRHPPPPPPESHQP